MIGVIRRICAVSAGAVVVGLAMSAAAAGQGSSGAAIHEARQLGGPTAFYAPPLRTAANLKQMAARKGMADDIRLVLRDSGIPETADAVLATLGAASASVKGGFCDEATPADGVIVECDFRPGSTLLWMALRPNIAKGNRTPGRLESVKWAGAKPFKAFLFRVTNDYKIYTFVLPLVCSNLSLMSVTEIPGEPVAVSVDRACDPATGNLRATVKGTSRDLERVQRVSVAINGQPAGDLTASAWTFTATKSGDYTFEATDTKGRSYALAPRTIRVEACPAPPPPPAPKTVIAPTCSVALSSTRVKGGYQIAIDATRSSTGTSSVPAAVSVDLRDDKGAAVGQKTLDSSLTGTITVRRHGMYRGMATVSTPKATEAGTFRYEGTSTCEATVEIEKPSGPAFFFDVLGGKERRVRPDADTGVDFAQCSPLAGVKLGVGKRFKNDWELAGAGGVAISLVNDSQKVKESALFFDVELNKYMSGGAFVGTGLSVWDVTRSDTWTPAWLLHFGLPLAKGDRHTLYFVGEGRLFFDHISDTSNNYLAWAGFRMRFGR
jgi:hypothetical protein